MPLITSNIKKYNHCKCTYYHIRELSDNLCKEHNLSVINPSNSKGKTYKEWQAEKNGNSLKSTLRKDIDDTITSYEDFIALMKAKGYEIKGEDLTDSNLKYISFRPLDRERFIRGSVRTLGENYTREHIKERIEEKTIHQTKKKVSFSKKKPTTDYSRKNLIDTSHNHCSFPRNATSFVVTNEKNLTSSLTININKNIEITPTNPCTFSIHKISFCIFIIGLQI